MIKQLGVNDVMEAATLMAATIEYDKDVIGYEGDVRTGGDRNEAAWVTHLITHIVNQGDPNYLAIKSVDDSGKMLGFMLASTYSEAYANKPVMDVKDMIVDYSAGKKANIKTVTECFDYMIEYTKAHGGKDWRADSIHSEEYALGYVNFLAKRYDAKIKYSVRGIIQ